MKSVSVALLKKALSEGEFLYLEKKIEAAQSEPYKKPMTTAQYLNSLGYKKHELETAHKYTKSARNKMWESDKPYPHSPAFDLLIAIETILQFLSRDLNRQLAKEGMAKVRREL